jgi:thymidylate kinase
VEIRLAGLSIGVIGTDGSGKTTLVNKLVEELNRRGFSTKKVWFRFPRFLTFSLLLIAKLTGFTKYKSDGKHRVAIHYFQARPFRILYPALVLVDVIAHYIVKVWIPSKLGYVLVFDRWIHDILIDIAIDTCNPHFFHTLFGRLLYSLASRTTVVILVDASDQVLNARRPEARLDPYTYKRRLFYRLFGNFSGVYSTSSDVDLDIMWKELENFLEQKAKISFETMSSATNKVKDAHA